MRINPEFIDEFELDSKVLTKAKDVVALPDLEQIEPLKQLVRDYPDQHRGSDFDDASLAEDWSFCASS